MTTPARAADVELPPAAKPLVPSGTAIAVRGVLVAAAAAAAVLMAAAGIVVDTYPPFLPGTSSTAITRYSGPWLTAAAGAALIAGLSVMSMISGLRRRAGGRRS